MKVEKRTSAGLTIQSTRCLSDYRFYIFPLLPSCAILAAAAPATVAAHGTVLFMFTHHSLSIPGRILYIVVAFAYFPSHSLFVLFFLYKISSIVVIATDVVNANGQKISTLLTIVVVRKRCRSIQSHTNAVALNNSFMRASCSAARLFFFIISCSPCFVYLFWSYLEWSKPH